MYDRNTRIKEIAHLPGLGALVERHTGQRMSPIHVRMAANFTLAQAGAYMRWSDEQLDAVIAEVNALAEGGPQR